MFIVLAEKLIEVVGYGLAFFEGAHRFPFRRNRCVLFDSSARTTSEMET
jgi:hypothetical protein